MLISVSICVPSRLFKLLSTFVSICAYNRITGVAVVERAYKKAALA